MASQKNKKYQLFYTIWWIFLDGLFAILPLTLTIALFSFSLRILKRWLAPINHFIDQTPLVIVPHSEIILMIISIFLVGLILKVFLLRSLINWVESLFARIPLIRPIYSGIKQLVQAFNFQEDKKITFKQVVLIEFPRKGLYSLGFLTGQLPAELAPTKDQQYYNIFIPTTPNPTTGYYIILPADGFTVLDLTRQEAMALIISGRIILPERFEKK